MYRARAIFFALAGGLGACAIAETAPSAVEESQVVGPQFAPPGNKCILGFALVLNGPQVTGDGLGSAYSDGVDKVVAFTGSGDGFRFDTNGSQQIETAQDIRRVRLDFTGTGYEAEAPVPKGIDLRFAIARGSLNLCAVPVGESRTVPAGLNFISSVTGGTAKLLWGGVLAGSLHDCGAQGVSPLTVTRPAQSEWRLVSGPTACLYHGGTFQAVVAMPIDFTITAQGPVP